MSGYPRVLLTEEGMREGMQIEKNPVSFKAAPPMTNKKAPRRLSALYQLGITFERSAASELASASAANMKKIRL